jgi:hypothetical protein
MGIKSVIAIFAPFDVSVKISKPGWSARRFEIKAISSRLCSSKYQCAFEAKPFILLTVKEIGFSYFTSHHSPQLALWATDISSLP